jgi:hypothetical protein
MTDLKRGPKGYVDYMDPELIDRDPAVRYKEADEPLCHHLLNQIEIHAIKSWKDRHEQERLWHTTLLARNRLNFDVNMGNIWLFGTPAEKKSVESQRDARLLRDREVEKAEAKSSILAHDEDIVKEAFLAIPRLTQAERGVLWDRLQSMHYPSLMVDQGYVPQRHTGPPHTIPPQQSPAPPQSIESLLQPQPHALVSHSPDVSVETWSTTMPVHLRTKTQCRPSTTTEARHILT